MPAVRQYIVVQEREVKITASSPTEAIALAQTSFSQTDQDNRDNGTPIPRETVISARTEF